MKRLVLPGPKAKPVRTSLDRLGANAAAAPGSYHLGLTDAPSAIRVVVYDTGSAETHRVDTIAEAATFRAPGKTLWVDIIGLSRATLDGLASAFSIHPLALEDAAQAQQRAKFDQYPAHDALIARMLHVDPAKDGLSVMAEQVTFMIGDDFVISLQEREGDPFEPVRKRIRDGKGRIRGQGAAYLAYALLDAIVDFYFPLLESVGDAIEVLEDEIAQNATQEQVARIHTIRRTLVQFRRAVWPLREMLNTLARGDIERFDANTRVFLRDTLDHVMRILDFLESYREMGASLMDLHMSVTSQRMNETMQLLSVIATIFIPLTFVAGLYGMNFDTSSPYNMPEVQSPYGYPIALGAMLLIAIALLIYFRRRGWLGGAPRPRK